MAARRLCMSSTLRPLCSHLPSFSKICSCSGKTASQERSWTRRSHSSTWTSELELSMQVTSSAFLDGPAPAEKLACSSIGCDSDSPSRPWQWLLLLPADDRSKDCRLVKSSSSEPLLQTCESSADSAPPFPARRPRPDRDLASGGAAVLLLPWPAGRRRWPALAL